MTRFRAVHASSRPTAKKILLIAQNALCSERDTPATSCPSPEQRAVINVMQYMSPLTSQTNSRPLMTAFFSFPTTHATRAIWHITTSSAQTADTNLRTIGGQIFKKNQLQLFCRNLNFSFFKVRSDHLPTPAFSCPQLNAAGLCNAAHSVSLLPHNVSPNTSLTRHHIFCAVGQHEYRKETSGLTRWDLFE